MSLGTKERDCESGGTDFMPDILLIKKVSQYPI
jgi:hypothetical protein